MKNKIFLILALNLFLNADINTKIKSIIGNSDYNKHQNLINYIFKNNSEYYDSNNLLNYSKVTEKLQNNGILKLEYASTKYIDVTFTLTNNPKKSIKILKNILKSLGYYYYFTKEATKSDDKLKWKIKLKTAAAMNPLRLSNELDKNNCKILDIKREGDNWNYLIDTNSSYIQKAENLVDNNSINIKKISSAYLIRIDKANAINILSNSGNRWHPSIVFYGNDLNVIETFKHEELHKSLRLDVPNDTKYIKIDDLYTLANLRRGFNITKE